MNIRETLLEEHSKKNTSKLVQYIGNDSRRFAELMRLFFGKEKLVSQRAAWVFTYCVEANPELVRPYFKKLIANLTVEGLHDAVLRNTVRTLQHIDIPRVHLGALANACFGLVLKHESAIAVKAFSITILYNIAKKEPELKSEIALVVSELIPNGSSGIKNHGAKILKALAKLEASKRVQCECVAQAKHIRLNQFPASQR
ncbi:MAG: hypothetical protein ACRCYO_20290 [Bacteroidia bacterium]